MKFINTQQELKEFADEYKLRKDWHEPDEQNLTARVSGTHLDNAMGADPHINCGELVVILELIHPGDSSTIQVASINLANLLAWATPPRRDPYMTTVQYLEESERLGI